MEVSAANVAVDVLSMYDITRSNQGESWVNYVTN